MACIRIYVNGMPHAFMIGSMYARNMPVHECLPACANLRMRACTNFDNTFYVQISVDSCLLNVFCMVSASTDLMKHQVCVCVCVAWLYLFVLYNCFISSLVVDL